MPINLAVATLASTNFLPQDDAINTFWFDSSSNTDGDNIKDMIKDFYDDLGTILSEDTFTGGLRVQITDIGDPIPRVPWYDEFTNFITTTGAALPREVALAMSYTAAPVSGVPPARRRGRIFLGGLSIATHDPNAGRPTDAARTTIGAAASQLRAASVASLTHTWGIYSRVDLAIRPIVGGAVDNAWDTQRRRGLAPTDKFVWS